MFLAHFLDTNVKDLHRNEKNQRVIIFPEASLILTENAPFPGSESSVKKEINMEYLGKVIRTYTALRTMKLEKLETSKAITSVKNQNKNT